MAPLKQRTKELLSKKSLSVKEASELTGRSLISFYNAHIENKLRGVPPGDKLHLDTREVLIYSSRSLSRKDLHTKAEQLLEELDKLTLAETVAEEPVPNTEITEGDKLTTPEVQPTTEEQSTEEEVTDAHPIPEVTLESDPAPVISFNNLFDTVAITLMAIFFTTAILMVASKENLFGGVIHYVSETIKSIGAIFG